MLTRKQHDLLRYIDAKLRGNGVSPSFDEMKDALGLKSKSGVHRLIGALQERGFIRRLPHRARALEVIRLPEDMITEAPDHTASSGAQPLSPVREQDNRMIEVPLLGKIAAGTPIEALQNPLGTAQAPAALLGAGEHYALTIDGDSMIEAGILDGDTVIVRRCDTAENGAIVVALVDDHEATLKILRRSAGQIELTPANRAYRTRRFAADRVKVQGRLAGLLRSY